MHSQLALLDECRCTQLTFEGFHSKYGMHLFWEKDYFLLFEGVAQISLYVIIQLTITFYQYLMLNIDIVLYYLDPALQFTGKGGLKKIPKRIFSELLK